MITPSGRLLWLVGLVFVPACAAPAFLSRGERYVALSAALIFVIALADALLSRELLGGLELVLPATIRATLNETARFTVELHRPAGTRTAPSEARIAIALPPEVEPITDDIVMPVPAPQHLVKGEIALLGRERGRFSIKRAVLGASSRLRLWHLRRSVTVDADILVEPALAQIAKEAAKLLASHQQGGKRILARNGRGREFEQLREYVPSDDFGDIDWKATARRRLPIVRDYQIERTQDVYACIDCSRLSGRTVQRKDELHTVVLDEYIRATLLLHFAIRASGDRFGFAIFSNRVEYFVKASHTAQFDRVFHQALYPLRPKTVAPAFDEMCALLRTRVKRRALIVFFTSLAEPQLAEAFLEASRLLVRQHLVVVACPTDLHAEPLFSSPDVKQLEDLYGKLAGHLLWKKLEEVRVQLSRTGVRMHTVAPGRLGLLAATEYLDIKERQLL